MAQLFEALRYVPGDSIPVGVFMRFWIDLIFPVTVWLWGRLTEVITRGNSCWVKAAGT